MQEGLNFSNHVFFSPSLHLIYTVLINSEHVFAIIWQKHVIQHKHSLLVFSKVR